MSLIDCSSRLLHRHHVSQNRRAASAEFRERRRRERHDMNQHDLALAGGGIIDKFSTERVFNCLTGV
jgi:hypothetical protein